MFKQASSPSSDGASAPRRRFISGSDGQRSAAVGPLEWLGHRFVEVVDEHMDAVTEVLHGDEAGALQETAGQNAEPQLDLIEQEARFGV